MHASACVLLLCAGDSKRFGSDKRFAKVDDQAMCVASANIYLQSGCALTIIVRKGEAERFAALFSQRAAAEITFVENSAENPGLSDSLSTGLRWAAQESDCDYALIALADMPYIKKDTVNYLLKELGDADLLALEYLGKTGHPRAIKRHLFHAACRGSGDRGARELFAEKSDYEVRRLACNDPAILKDIDYPDDLD